MATLRPSADAPIPFIGAADVRRFTPMIELINALDAAFCEKIIAPTRHAHQISAEASLLLMPAWQAHGAIGVKITAVHRNHAPAIKGLYVLLDEATGQPRAVMDGASLTARRTAAASGLAARYLARADARHLLMIGTGALAPELVEAHASVRPIDRVSIWGRDPDKARHVANLVAREGRDVTVVTDLDAAIQTADVISAATLSTTPLITGSLVKPGTHIDLVGAFRPEMCEADAKTFARARVFVDTRDGALEEAGDLLQAIACGAFDAAAIEADLSQLCDGTHAGRDEREQDITLFKSVGTAIEDLAAANLIFRSWQAERS